MLSEYTCKQHVAEIENKSGYSYSETQHRSVDMKSSGHMHLPFSPTILGIEGALRQLLGFCLNMLATTFDTREGPRKT